jgi:hypothetical protein
LLRAARLLLHDRRLAGRAIARLLKALAGSLAHDGHVSSSGGTIHIVWT